MVRLTASSLAERYACDVPRSLIEKIVKPTSSTLVYRIKNSRSVHTYRILLRFLGYTVALERAMNGRYFMLSLEGLLQGMSVQKYLKSLPAHHGAPIPLKRVFDEDGRLVGYASTFPILVVCRNNLDECWSNNDAEFYASYKYGYARLVIDAGGKLIIDDESPIRMFEEFLTTSIVFRGEMYITWYDYLRLGKTPPDEIATSKFMAQRGMQKKLWTHAPVLIPDVMYIFATADGPEIKGREMIDELIDNHPAGLGWKGVSMIVAKQIYPFYTGWRVPKPEDILFAELKSGKGYVLLRPMPARLWDRDEVVWGYDENMIVPMRLVPPYFNVRRGRLMELQFLPGTIVSKKPKLRYEGV